METHMSGPAEQFTKTRRDHATETAEDYVEAIAEVLTEQEACRVKDLAHRMGVSHVTVTRILARLAGEGLVHKEPYGPVTLTATGHRMADASRQRHEVVYRFLLALGVPKGDAAKDAEGMEHHLSPTTLKRMKSFLAR